MKKKKIPYALVELTEPMPSEFTPEESLYEFFDNHGLMIGRMLSGSKSFYREQYPDHEVYFNANIVTESRGKCWYGDIDVTTDLEKLKEIATILKESLYVLREMDARFENKDQPFDFYKNKAVAKIEP